MRRKILLLHLFVIFSYCLLQGQNLEHLYPIFQLERNYFTLNPAAAGAEPGEKLILSNTLRIEDYIYSDAVNIYFDKASKSNLGWALVLDIRNAKNVDEMGLTPSFSKTYHLQSGAKVALGIGVQVSSISFTNTSDNVSDFWLFVPKIGASYHFGKNMLGLSALFPGLQHFTPNEVVMIFPGPPLHHESSVSLFWETVIKLNRDWTFKPIVLLNGSRSYRTTGGIGLNENSFHAGYLDVMTMLTWKEKNSFSATMGFTKASNSEFGTRLRGGVQFTRRMGPVLWAVSARFVDSALTGYGNFLPFQYSITYFFKS